MIIVNQGKDQIINFDNTGKVEIDAYQRPFQINVCVNDIWTELGQYETRERTKEVLQEIVQAYIAGEKCYCMPKE